MEKKELQIIVHNSANGILSSFLEGRDDPKHVFTIEDAQPKKITKSAYLKRIKRQKYWGFCEGGYKIHIWFEPEVEMDKLVRLIAHEKGHTLKPAYRDDNKEEEKAELYATTAQFAYNAAKLLKEHANDEKKRKK